MQTALLAGTAACAMAWACAPVLAQDAPAQGVAQEALPGFGVEVGDDAQLFLEADTVTYDSDTGVVTAGGGVQIDYGGYKLVSREVVYNQETRRLIARGDVELVEPDGNRIYADTADITDDFAEGFVQALRIETPDNTRFAAANAIRENGDVTTFEEGVYTACEACAENPERAPLWQVKARRIVWNQREKVVRYYGAQFELFGAPLAYLPYFESPDPTVRRKTGLLAPSFVQGENTGFGVRVPYFIVLGDDKDLTLSGSYYSEQGFLGEAEYRQAFANGGFTLKTAGIHQMDPDAFLDESIVNPLTGEVLQSPGFLNTDRGMIGTTGRFALSDQWTFGWDVLAQSDQNFSATYDIAGFSDTRHISEIYLTGLGDRSYFDLRTQKFDVQTKYEFEEEEQPLVLPTLDYERIETLPRLGGEVELDVNVINLNRQQASTLNSLCFNSVADENFCLLPEVDFFRDGLPFQQFAPEGSYSRATSQAEWRRTFTTQGGLLLTPSASARGDLYSADVQSDGDDYLDAFRDQDRLFREVDIDDSGTRGMVTGAFEARYPYLIETAGASHVIEPVAQVLVRPDEMKSGLLPNEDAQTLVFSTSNLFQEDKFSGFDRIEGGSRANVGLIYSGTLATGYAVNATLGQSFHLGGENPFDQPDLTLVGFDSGLESDRSDYVSSVALTMPIGLEIGAQGRFDEESLDLRRSDLFTTLAYGPVSAGLTYSSLSAQPVLGSFADRSQVQGNLSFDITEEWTAFGSLGYDVENETMFRRGIGVSYADECFSLLVSYQETVDRYQDEPAESRLLFTVGLRTIADTGFSYDLDGEEEDTYDIGGNNNFN